MQEADEQGLSYQSPKWKSSIISCLVSLISVFFTQFTLSLLPLFLPISSFLALLPLSALLLVIVVGIGRFCKRVAGVRASAPAFVFFSIILIWAFYIYVVRQVISSLVDIAFNIEVIMVIIGLCCIMSLDPGFVTRHSSCQDELEQSPLCKVESQQEESRADKVFTTHRRARYCKHCKNYVVGFDHHCPAFGNCIGQRNHLLFIVLLIGFVVCEATFVACASQFTAESPTLYEVGREQATTFSNLVLGTTLFCLIQVLWQVVFVLWHVYCACFNIKTDEWINWKKYPEFQIKIISHAGQA
ncbi:DHHC-type Zn-finger protein [Handroanthus impetiginosus]|uniref:S-acyltransferase n=1 Tax=Handroanthus impetiginosus TaxID=429701 RepID=A0A2G9HWW3_9LAMI|nr:DHHC-type Zn-finger protein [Handroanthus impetiginosus]